MRVPEALERGDDLVGNQLSGASRAEVEALIGVFALLRHHPQKAARGGRDEVTPVIHTCRTMAALARNALLVFNNHRLPGFWKAWGYDVPADAVAALCLMRDRRMTVLPTPPRSA